MTIEYYYLDQYLDEIWYIANLFTAHYADYWFQAESQVASSLYNIVLAIDELYYATDDAIQDVIDSIDNQVEDILTQANAYADEIYDSLIEIINSDYYTLSTAIQSTYDTLYWYIEYFYDQSIAYTESVGQWLYAYANQVYDASIQYTQDTATWLINYTNQEVAKAFQYTDIREEVIKQIIDDLKDELTGDIDGLSVLWQADIDAAVGSLEATIDLVSNDLYTMISEQTSSIWAWLMDTGNDIYDWIAEKVTAVWDWLSDTGNAIYTWANEQLDKLWLGLNELSQWVSEKVAVFTEYIEGEIAFIYNELKAAVQSLLDLSNWRFEFNIMALALPEFGMLSAMTRTDNVFDYHKPYWKAFFARVLGK